MILNILLALILNIILHPVASNVSPIRVRRGFSVSILPEHIPLLPRFMDMQVCQIEVDQHDPITSRVGTLIPKSFPCNFGNVGTVHYVHNGNPLLTKDTVRIHIFYFFNNNSRCDSALLKVEIEPPPLLEEKRTIWFNGSSNGSLNNNTSTNSDSFIVRIKPLIVNTWKDKSQPLNPSTLQLRYNHSEFLCQMSYGERYHSRVNIRLWPLLGTVIYHNNEIVTSFRHECQAALLMGYRYAHQQTTSAASTDYLPLLLSLMYKNGTLYYEEALFYPIEIKNSLPNEAPKIAVLEAINISHSGSSFAPFPKDFLSISAEETSPEGLIVNFTIIESSVEAQLVHMLQPSFAILSFTLQDLRNGFIHFQIKDYSPLKQKHFLMRLTVSDAYFAVSNEVEVHIYVRLSHNYDFEYFTSPLFTYTSAINLIREHNLHAVGKINENDILYLLLFSENRNGTVYAGRKELSAKLMKDIFRNTFRTDTIKNHLLTYHHNGGQSSRDLLQVRAQYETSSFDIHLPVHIVTLWRVYRVPLLKPFTKMSVSYEDTKCLQATDLFDEKILDLIADKGSWIEFLVKVGPKQGYLGIGSEQNPPLASSALSYFSLEQLLRGTVCYVHSNSEELATSDSFQIQDPRRVPSRYTLSSIVTIHIMGNSFSKTLLTRKSEIEPNITISETDDYVVLNRSVLLFESATTPMEGIVFEITKPPHLSDLITTNDAGRLVNLKNAFVSTYEGDTVKRVMLKNIKQVEIPSVKSFTQADIVNGDIAYVPPREDTGAYSLEVSILFDVFDTRGCVKRNQLLTLFVEPVNNQPPIIKQGNISVQRDGELVFTQQHILIMDLDTEMNEIKLLLLHLPKYGTLFNEAGKTLSQNSTFEISEWMNGKIRYKHSGTNKNRDQFTLRATDGVQWSKAMDIQINITKRIFDLAHWNRLINDSIGVPENSSVQLPFAAFVKGLSTNPSENLIIYFVSLPTRGRIVKHSESIFHFQLKDVEQGNIVYRHSPREIGPKPVHDFAKVWAFETGKMMVLNFVIIPMNSQPPVVHSTAGIFVNEGGSAEINTYSLFVTDLDTEEADLHLELSELPSWGTLILKSVDQGRMTLTALSTNDPFSMRDVQEGMLYYSNNKNDNGTEENRDVIRVKASDGKFWSKVVSIPVTINMLNDEMPVMTLMNFTVGMGQTIVLTPYLFNVVDQDEPKDDLQISILKFPQSGRLAYHWHTGTRELIEPDNADPFPGHYLATMNLLFLHNAAMKNIAEDSFTIQVTDGKHVVSKTAHIRITKSSSEILSVRVTRSLLLSDSSSSQTLTDQFIVIEGANSPRVLQQNITFSLLQEPEHGKMESMRSVRSTSASSGRLRVGRDVMTPVMMKVGDTFTAEDLREKHIRYYRSKNASLQQDDALKDKISLQVSDGYNFVAVDVPVVFLNSPANTATTTSPVKRVRTEPIRATRDEKYTITTANVHLEGATEEFSMSVTLSLRRKLFCGLITNIDQPLVAIEKFAYIDLKQKKISLFLKNCPSQVKDIFIPLYLESGSWSSKALLKAFILEVEVTTVAPSTKPHLVHNKPLRISQRSMIYLNNDLLRIEQNLVDPTNITYYLQTASRSGKFVLAGSSFPVDSFTQNDIDTWRVKFIASSSLSGVLEDREMIQLHAKTPMPPPEGSRLSFAISIHLVPSQSLYLMRNNIAVNLTTYQGYSAIRLSSQLLQSSHPESVYSVVHEPKCGYLFHHKLQRFVLRFTQIDLDVGAVYFLLDRNAAQQLSEDQFIFNVNAPQETPLNSQIFLFQWNVVEFEKEKVEVCSRPGLMKVNIIRRGPPQLTVDVNVDTRSATALLGKDFKLLTHSLVRFKPNEYVKELDIQLLPFVQKSKYFSIFLKMPANSLLGRISNATVFINEWKTCDKDFVPWKSQTQDTLDNAAQSYESSAVSRDMIHDSNQQRVDQIDNNPLINPIVNLPSDEQLAEEYTRYLKKLNEIKSGLSSRSAQNVNLACSTGWKLYQNRCYFLSNNTIIGSKAREYCSTNGAMLATIYSGEHMKWVRRGFASKKRYWIGLTFEGLHQRWVWQNSVEMQFRAWANKFPKPVNANKNMCVLTSKRDKWKNRSCLKGKAAALCMKTGTVI